MESVALLTKEIWIVTPLVLGIVVCVAPRLISYHSPSSDHIVQVKQREVARLYRTCRTKRRRQIVSYMGYGDGGLEEKRKRGSPMYLREVW